MKNKIFKNDKNKIFKKLKLDFSKITEKNKKSDF